MPQEGIPDYLALRVVDNYNGNELVRDLQHAHQTTWQVRALQQGMAGSSTLGTFTIRSPSGPLADEAGKWLSQWQTLDPLNGRQRIEGYLGGVITGSPRFSGVITGMRKPLDQPWEITGVDSLWMLQQSQVKPGELLAQAGNGAFAFAFRFSGTDEIVWDDDFSGGSTDLTNNYNSSNWSAVSADPVFGLPAITSTSTAVDAFAITKTTWNATAQYYSSSVTIHGVMVAGTDTSIASEADIILLGDSTWQNGYLITCRMLQTGVGTGLYNVYAQIFTKSAGTYTQQGSNVTMFTNVGATFPFEVTAIYAPVPGTPPGIRVLVNGKDSGLQFQGFASIASGGVGVRFQAVAGGSPAVYVNRIQFRGRTSGVSPNTTHFDVNRFVLGNVNSSSTLVFTEALASTGQTFLDMWQLGMTFDGYFVRKTPGYGFKSDVLDYGGAGSATNSGTDYSASIVIEEGINVEANGTEVATVPEMLATDVRVNAQPGGTSGGSITWGRIGAANDPVLTDTVADMGIPGFALLVNYARQVQSRKTNPLQAKQVRVIRTADWLSVGNGAGPRELDSVLVRIRTLGINDQVAQIMGYDFVEGDATMLVYLSALPSQAAPLHTLQRLARPIEYMGTTYATR